MIMITIYTDGILTRASLNERLLLAPNDAQAKGFKGIPVISQDDSAGRQHGIVLINKRGVLGRLLNGVHLLFAGLLVHRTYYQGYPRRDITGGTELGLQ